MCSVMTVWQREAPRGPKVGMRRVLHDPGELGKRVKRETRALLRSAAMIYIFHNFQRLAHSHPGFPGPLPTNFHDHVI